MGSCPTLDSPLCHEAGWLSAGPGPVATTHLATFACTWLGRKARTPTDSDTYGFVDDATAKAWLLNNGLRDAAERWFGGQQPA